MKKEPWWRAENIFLIILALVIVGAMIAALSHDSKRYELKKASPALERIRP